MTRAERNAMASRPLPLTHRRQSVPAPTPGTSPALRPATVVTATGNGPRRSRRDPATKGQGEWRTVSQNYSTHATHDARWALTAHTNPA